MGKKERHSLGRKRPMWKEKIQTAEKPKATAW